MLNEVTKHLDQSMLTGLKIGTVGFLVAGIGAAVAFLSVKVFNNARSIELLGVGLFGVGASAVFSGMAIHFYLMFKKLFRRK